MKLAQKLSLLLLALLGIAILSLGAATAQATYEEDFDTELHKSSDFGIQSAGFNDAFHVGTLTIRSVGNGSVQPLYSLRIERPGNFGGGREYDLQSTTVINYMTVFGSQVVAKIKYGSTTIVKLINWSSGEDPLASDDITTAAQYPITIDFYLGVRNINNSAQATDAGFQFKGASGPNLGNFTIMYRKTSGWGTEYTIPFGASSTTPQAFFTTNYNQGSTKYLNKSAINKTVYVSLKIEQTPSQASINLVNASGSSKATVGSARLTLTGYNSSSPQGVTLTFADGNGSTNSSFRLKHSELNYYIPFFLYLGGAPVDRGVPITWPNLSFGSNNLKDLQVGGIDYQSAVSAMGGSYSDTITVTITPLDSNLVGQ